MTAMGLICGAAVMIAGARTRGNGSNTPRGIAPAPLGVC
jgi:hypothetical protein